MEKMPFRDQPRRVAARTDGTSGQVISSDWRAGLPLLSEPHVTLRELRLSDAPSLLAMLTTEEVSRFISPPPTTVEGFERFILWSHQQRTLGAYICFAIVPEGYEDAVGLFQVRQLEPGFGTAEWGFALGSSFWGTGVFPEAAGLVVDFVFDVVGTHRLEARAAVANGRGNGALKRLGAVQEGILRKSLFRHGLYLDQILWAIVEEDWRLARSGRLPRVH